MIEKVTKRLEMLADGGTIEEEAKEVAAPVPLSKKEAARKERMEKVVVRVPCNSPTCHQYNWQAPTNITHRP
jgi:UDP-N-acetylglucosamine 2-epimerase